MSFPLFAQAFHPRPYQRGLTLIELMMGLAVVAILLGAALPAFGDLVERQRVVGAHNDMVATMHYARALALTERRNAVVCPTTDGSRCEPGGVWDQGWMVFVDHNDDRQRNADEDIERIEQRPRQALQIRSSAFRPHAVFRPNGMSGASNLTLRLCDPDGVLRGALVLNNTGRLRKAADAALPGMGDCA